LVKSTWIIGGVNPDSQFFDDYHDITSKLDPSFPTLSELKVWGDNYVFGIQAIYKDTDGKIIEGPAHLGSGFNSTLPPPTLFSIKLDDDEIISEISGRAGAIVDAIKVTTSKGKKLECGGKGGMPVNNLLDKTGGKICGIGGGTNGHMHNLHIYYI